MVVKYKKGSWSKLHFEIDHKSRMPFPKFVQKVLIQGNFKSTKVTGRSLCKLEGGYMCLKTLQRSIE